MTQNTQAPRTATHRDPDFARQKVESGSTAFELGRAYRSYKKSTLNLGERYVAKVVTPVDVAVTSIVLNVTAGEIEYQSMVLPDSESGFVNTLPVFPLNNRTDRGEPSYTPQLVVTDGGDIVGGTETDQAVVRTGNNNQRASLVEETQNKRGAAPGTYYVVLTGGAANSDFTFYASWEEYP